MRIIYVTSSMPYGPAETFVISEVEEVRKQGHEVLVVPMYPRGSVLHADANAEATLPGCPAVQRSSQPRQQSAAPSQPQQQSQ